MCYAYSTKYTVVVKQGVAILTLTTAPLSIAFSFFFVTLVFKTEKEIAHWGYCSGQDDD